MVKQGVRVGGAALCLFTALSCGGVAAAQEMSAAAGRPVGESSLNYAFSLTETYDSNVARRSDAATSATRLKPEDYRTTVNLNLDVLKAVGRQSLFLAGDVGYNYYDRNTVLDRQRIGLEGGVVARAAICQVVLSDKVASAQTSLDLLINTVIENEQNVNTVSASGQCSRGVGIAPTFSIASTQIRNSASLMKGQDNDSTSGSIGLAYSRPVLGRVSIFAQQTNTDYTKASPIFVLTGRTPGYELKAVGISFERAVGERLSLSSHLSYSSISQKISAQSNFEGLTYGGRLMIAPNHRASLELTGERAVRPSLQVGSTYELLEDYAENLTYRLSERLSLTGGATQSRITYAGTVSGPTLVLPGQSVQRVFGGVTYDFLRRNTIRLEVRQEERRSNVAAFNYESNQVSLTYIRHN
jgi:hypothetical protein